MMFDFNESQRLAEDRLGRASKRRRRSDAGRSRLHPVILEEIRSLLFGFDRPSMTAVVSQLAHYAARHGLRAPSRASVYNALARIPGHVYPTALLPDHVREVLYNLPAEGEVPGHQLVFYCFNYGSLPEVSYAAGLPWLDLFQASERRGWRPRSRGLLEAVMRVRGVR
jgi:hypothetical protein